MKLKLLGLAVAACCAAFALGQQHPWGMRFSDSRRTGQSFSPGASDGVLAWKYRVAGNVPGFAASSNGDIVMGITFNGNWWSNESYLSALTSNGQVSWRMKVTPYQWGASQGVSSSPALTPDGGIVVPSTYAQLFKLRPDLSQEWLIQMNNFTINDSSPAVLPDGSIRHIQAGVVHMITAGGNEFGTASGGGGTGSVAVAPNGDMAAVNNPIDQSQQGTRIWYWNADGTLRWRTVGLAGGNRSTPVFGPDGVLYASPKGTSLIAYNPDGSVKWQDPAPIAGTTPALGANGQLYSYGGASLRATNKDTGATLWTVTLSGSINQGLAIDSRNVVYATTSNGYICAVSPAGLILWQTKHCDAFSTGPIVGPDSQCVAFGTEGFEKFVYAIR